MIDPDDFKGWWEYDEAGDHFEQYKMVAAAGDKFRIKYHRDKDDTIYFQVIHRGQRGREKEKVTFVVKGEADPVNYVLFNELDGWICRYMRVEKNDGCPAKLRTYAHMVDGDAKNLIFHPEIAEIDSLFLSKLDDNERSTHAAVWRCKSS